jgi:hypothetical protein
LADQTSSAAFRVGLGHVRPLRDVDPFRKPMDKRLSKCKVIRVRPRDTKNRWTRRLVWITLAATLTRAAFAAWQSL